MEGKTVNPTTLPDESSYTVGRAAVMLLERILAQPGGKELINAKIAERASRTQNERSVSQ